MSMWIYIEIFLLLILVVISVTCQPYFRVDLSQYERPNESMIKQYIIDYSPAIGKPSPPIRLSRYSSEVIVNDTLPAVMYTVDVISEMIDGDRTVVVNDTFPSSPEPPLVDKVDSKSTEIFIQLFPSDAEDITYLVNYSLVSSGDDPIFEAFLDPFVTLTNLSADSEYDIYIYTVFNGVYSHAPYRTTVRTLPYSFTHSHLSLIVSSIPFTITSGSNMESSISTTEMVSTTEITSGEITDTEMEISSTGITPEFSAPSTTQLPSTDLQLLTSSQPSTSTPQQETTPQSILFERTSVITTDLTDSPFVHTTQVSIQTTTQGSKMLLEMTNATEVTKSGIPSITRTTDGPIDGRNHKSITHKISQSKGLRGGTRTEDGLMKETDEINESDEGAENEINHRVIPSQKKGRPEVIKIAKTPLLKSPLPIYNYSLPSDLIAQLPDSYGQPRSIEYAPEGRQLRINWRSPEGTNCSGYLLNYTIITLHIPKTFQMHIEGERTWALMKMFLNNIIQIEIYCLLEGSIVSKTPARVTTDLRKPNAIKNLRVSAVLTDDFFRSSIVIEWDWPSNHSMDVYSIVVTYYPGKAKQLKSQTVTVNEIGPLNITGLKPTETYTFSVKNISRLNIQSGMVELKRTMPPIISSTLLPGKVTSNSLLITYSPTDVDEARFDSYHLVACLTDTVNRTVIKAKADPNRNFLLKNLLPGYTYSFYLYTVYKKVRSRAVVANFTTYPLKVKSLFAIVRRNAIKLFYQPEDSPLKEIRYRLSFTGSDGSESDSVTVLNQREYVFDYLKPEIWYTFSVTVLMGDQESESTARTIVTGLNSDPVPHVRGSSPTTIDIAFRREFFTESNGIIQNYSIIIAEDYRLDYFNHSLLGWRSVQNYEVWPPYQVTPATYNPFTDPREEATTYTIGLDTCKIDDIEEFCNGPLKPHTEYFIKLRACTNEHICMETSYTKAATEKDTTPLEMKTYLNSRYHSTGGVIRRPSLICTTSYLVLLVSIFH